MKVFYTAIFSLTIFAMIVALETTSAQAQTQSLVGTWTNGSVGTIQYQNRTTGAIKTGRGSHFSYKFHANGTYEYVGYMESTLYNCTTTLFNQINGKYTFGDKTIQLDATKDLWKSTNSCAASGNKQKTKPVQKMTVTFDIRADPDGTTLLCITEKTGETCYRKEKQ